MFAEDVAASGGYLIACAGDEIYANSSSIVGLTLGVIAWHKKETKVLYIIGITASIIAFITSTMFLASIGILGIMGFIF